MNQINEYMNALRQENGLLPLPAGSEFPLTDEERDGDLLSKRRITEMIEAVDKNLLRQPGKLHNIYLLIITVKLNWFQILHHQNLKKKLKKFHHHRIRMK